MCHAPTPPHGARRAVVLLFAVAPCVLVLADNSTSTAVGDTCADVILPGRDGNYTSDDADAACAVYDNYAVAEGSAMRACADDWVAQGMGHRATCLCYLGMAQCTGESACANAAGYCERAMAAAGCDPAWCGVDAESLTDTATASIAYSTRSAYAGWEEIQVRVGLLQNLPESVRKEAHIEVTPVTYDDQRAPALFEATVAVTANNTWFPVDTEAYLQQALEDLAYNTKFRQASGVRACEGCGAVRETQSCMLFVYNASSASASLPATPGSAAEDSCDLWSAYPAPDALDAHVHTCAREARSDGFGRGSQCLCYLGFAKCAGVSSCRDAVGYCEGVMAAAGCDPTWCAGADGGVETTEEVEVHTLYRQHADVNRTQWLHAVEDFMPAGIPQRWLTTSLGWGDQFGYREDRSWVTITIPANTTVPAGLDTALTGYFKDLPIIPAFREAGAITAVKRVPERSCHAYIFDFTPAVTDTNTCADYAGFTAAAATVPTRQLTCRARGLAQGFSADATCACYASLGQCTTLSPCDEGPRYCEGVMAAAGCDPKWCLMRRDLPRDVAVTAEYATANASTAAAAADSIEDVLAEELAAALDVLDVNVLRGWLAVSIRGAARVATVTLTLPAGALFPENIGAALQQLLYDLPTSATIRGRTGITALATTPEPPTPAPVPTPAPASTAAPATSVPAMASTAAPATTMPAPSTNAPPAPVTQEPETTRAPTPPAPATDGDDDVDAGLIVGMVVAGVAVCGVALFVVRACRKHRTEFSTPAPTAMELGACAKAAPMAV